MNESFPISYSVHSLQEIDTVLVEQKCNISMNELYFLLHIGSKGPKGDKGTIGDTGDQGDVGDTGAKGADGNKGTGPFYLHLFNFNV